MAEVLKVYWDACAWIAYINQEDAVELSGGRHENRFAMCDKILCMAQDRKLEIVTSAFTLAEVCNKPKVKNGNDPVDNLPGFFEKSCILIVPVDMEIGLNAQRMQTSGIGGLKPPDAVHLASAQRASVAEFHSFDDVILKLDGKIPGADGSPMRICKPAEENPPGPLFEQGNDDDT